MTKLDLQKELLEKVKPGMKPSDIKKQRSNEARQKPGLKPSKSPIKNEPNQDDGYQSDPQITPAPSDGGYSSEEEKIPTAPPLPNSEQSEQIKALQKQLDLYKDFREADLKIKEKQKQELAEHKQTINDLQAKIHEWEQKYSELEKASKNTEKSKESPPPQPKTFTCSDCQHSQPLSQLSRQFSNFSFCLTCSKQARKQAQQEKTQPEPQDFICHACQQAKNEIPNKMKLDQTLQEYLICSLCRPTLKEFNEADLITDDLWTKYPYASASEILEKEFGLVKEDKW